jgi:acetyl esterase/lipase
MKKHLKKMVCYGPDSQQFGHLYKPAPKLLSVKTLPVVIVIHGGYWKDNHSLDTYATISIVDYLQDFDVAIWNLEYRRMEATGENRKAPWPTTFKDVSDGIDHLRILVIGHSAGGHLATWAASRENIPQGSELYQKNPLPIQSVISIAGILNFFAFNDIDQPEQLLRLMGGCPVGKPERYLACDPSTLHNPDINLTLVHGQQDRCVSVAQTEHYFANANANANANEKSQLEKIIMPQADHFSMLPHDGQWQPKQWQQIQALIGQSLKSLSSN